MKLNKKYINFTIITLVIGFMLAIQFQTVNSVPEARDTRDTWQLREAIVSEQERQLALLQEIRNNDEVIAKYESMLVDSKEQVLKDTLSNLKEEAGLTAVTGYGVKIIISRAFAQDIFGYPTISPDLLQRTINLLNQYGASNITISGHRYINTSVIRDINGETKIDGYSLRRLPIEILVIDSNQEEAKKLYNKLVASNLSDLYFLENLELKVSAPESEIRLPAYADDLIITELLPVKINEGGN